MSPTVDPGECTVLQTIIGNERPEIMIIFVRYFAMGSSRIRVMFASVCTTTVG